MIGCWGKENFMTERSQEYWVTALTILAIPFVGLFGFIGTAETASGLRATGELLVLQRIGMVGMACTILPLAYVLISPRKFPSS